MNTTREQIIDRLLAIPQEIHDAEATLLDRVFLLSDAKALLTEKETRLILAGLDGRNEQERKAWLYDRTGSERVDVHEIEEAHAHAALAVRILRDELSALRAIARIIGGGE